MTATVYADTSALVKLASEENESSELRRALRTAGPVVSTELAAVETILAVRRKGPAGVDRMRAQLEWITLIPLSRAIRRAAASAVPARLRAIDAIHLATALALRDRLDGFVAYDKHPCAAAREAGLEVLSPGAARRAG